MKVGRSRRSFTDVRNSNSCWDWGEIYRRPRPFSMQAMTFSLFEFFIYLFFFLNERNLHFTTLCGIPKSQKVHSVSWEISVKIVCLKFRWRQKSFFDLFAGWICFGFLVKRMKFLAPGLDETFPSSSRILQMFWRGFWMIAGSLVSVEDWKN